MRRTGWWIALVTTVALGALGGRAQAQPPVPGDEEGAAPDTEWGWDLPPDPGIQADDLAFAGETAWEDLDSADETGPGMSWALGPGAGMRHGGMHGMRGRMGRGGFGRGHGMGMGLGRLDLSDAQRKQIADITDRQMRQGIQARADLRIAQLDLRKLMREETPSKRSIENQIDRIGAIRSRMLKARAGAMLEIRSVLTDEERKQLREGRGGGRGSRRGSGPPRSGSDDER